MKEFNRLEELAEAIGYEFPEEIHEEAYVEGFYETDEQGDDHLSIAGINDFLSRLGEDMRVTSIIGGIIIAE